MCQDPLLRKLHGSQKSVQLVTILPSPTPSRLSHRFQSGNIEHCVATFTLHRFHLWLDTWQFGAKKIDVLSRSIFPISFITFNLTYWSYYLSQIPDEDK